MTSTETNFWAIPGDVHNTLLASYFSIHALQMIHICCKEMKSRSYYGLSKARILRGPHPTGSWTKFGDALLRWARQGGKFTQLETYCGLRLPLKDQEPILLAADESCKLETVVLLEPGPHEAAPYMRIIQHIKSRVKHLRLSSIWHVDRIKDEFFPALEFLAVIPRAAPDENPQQPFLPHAPNLRHLECCSTPLDSIPPLHKFPKLERLYCFLPLRWQSGFGSIDALASAIKQVQAILPESTRLNILFSTMVSRWSKQFDQNGVVYQSFASICLQGQTTLALLDFLVSEGYVLSNEPKLAHDVKVTTALETWVQNATRLDLDFQGWIRFLTDDKYNQIIFDHLPMAATAPAKIRDVMFDPAILEYSVKRAGWVNLDQLATYYSSHHIGRCNLLTHVLDTNQTFSMEDLRALTEYDRAKLLRIDTKKCSPFFSRACSSLIFCREALSYFFFDLSADPNLRDDVGRTVVEHLSQVTQQKELNAFVSTFKPKMLQQQKPFSR